MQVRHVQVNEIFINCTLQDLISTNKKPQSLKLIPLSSVLLRAVSNDINNKSKEVWLDATVFKEINEKNSNTHFL